MDVHDEVVEERPVLPDVDLEERVAQTNLSEVWRGRRKSNGAQVAVKFASTPAAAEALRSEAETVRAVSNLDGVVPAEFVEQPVPHLVLPWMGQRTFRNVIDEIQGGDDRARAMVVLLKVVNCVACVHERRFLHGDLKPENILIDEHGLPWLTDFGMARVIRAARLDSHVSKSMGGTKDEWGGTLNYLPPEGLHGEAPTAAWDVYALGVMMHEVLLGRRPDRAATPEELRSSLPEGVVAVLLRALAYSPADRISDADALWMELNRLRDALTADGLLRWALIGKRRLVTGLAAFFVALRYTSVFALLATYLVVLPLAIHRGGDNQGVWFMIYIAAFALHAVIRWEGPETPQEAALRRQGGVVAR